MKKSTFLISFLVLSTLSFTAFAYWQNPPGTPTSPNVDEPINVSSSEQTKDGKLNINDDFYVQGNIESATSVTITSDRNTKKDIKPLKSYKDLLDLEAVYYRRKNDNGESLGLIAQDVEKVYPELVFENQNGIKSLEYSKLVAPLLEIAKDQEKRLKKQEKEIQNLKEQIQDLK